MQVYDASTVSN